MNLLPELEGSVTRQEKMATVWDEAEVRAGRGGGPRAKARRDAALAGGEVWPDPRVEAAWDRGRDLESFTLVLRAGKQAVSGLGQSRCLPSVKNNLY